VEEKEEAQKEIIKFIMLVLHVFKPQLGKLLLFLDPVEKGEGKG